MISCCLLLFLFLFLLLLPPSLFSSFLFASVALRTTTSLPPLRGIFLTVNAWNGRQTISRSPLGGEWIILPANWDMHVSKTCVVCRWMGQGFRVSSFELEQSRPYSEFLLDYGGTVIDELVSVSKVMKDLGRPRKTGKLLKTLIRAQNPPIHNRCVIHERAIPTNHCSPREVITMRTLGALE